MRVVAVSPFFFFSSLSLLLFFFSFLTPLQPVEISERGITVPKKGVTGCGRGWERNHGTESGRGRLFARNLQEYLESVQVRRAERRKSNYIGEVILRCTERPVSCFSPTGESLLDRNFRGISRINDNNEIPRIGGETPLLSRETETRGNGTWNVEFARREFQRYEATIGSTDRTDPCRWTITTVRLFRD